MRIGIFGGTFDPIHYGHLRAAEEARETFGLEKVLFIPSAHPPHKNSESVSPAEHRLEMVRLAVAGHPSFEASDLECRRPGASYSVETLRILHDQEGADVELYFLTGMDAFLEIHTWRDHLKLFELSHWVVVQRPGSGPRGRKALPAHLRGVFQYDRSGRVYVHPGGQGVYFRRFRCMEISGREIRQKVRNGCSVRYLLPEPVENYIRRYGLYVGRS